LIAVQFLGIVYNINIKKAEKALKDAEMNDIKELASLAGIVEEVAAEKVRLKKV